MRTEETCSSLEIEKEKTRRLEIEANMKIRIVESNNIIKLA